MSRDFPESDWKLLRSYREFALERFCERTLKETMQAAMADSQTAHERYLAVFRLIHKRDEELARAFNDSRRSMALLQLMTMVSLDLLTPEELADFTPATQHALATILQIRA